jgi:hypothetical protein
MSIFGAIFRQLIVDLDNYLRRRKGRVIFQKYFISKDSAEMAMRLSIEIDKAAEILSANNNRDLRPSPRQNRNV